MQKRNRNRIDDRLGNEMHRIRTQRDALGAARFELAGDRGKVRPGLVPSPFFLPRGDLRELDAVQQHLR